MKQLVQLFLFDIKSSMKSFMGGYMIIVPLLILIILRTFLPSVESTSANIAVVATGPNAVEKELIEELEQFADVSTYDTIDEMERKLRGSGSAEGLYRDPVAQQYVSVVERTRESNTVFSTGARVVRQYTYAKDNPSAPRISRYTFGVPPELSDRTKTSPVATVGGSIFISFMLIICGFLIGLNIINDKEEGTIQAIRTSPANKVDYFVGKSIFPLLVLALYTIIGLLLLKLTQVDILQTYVVAILSYTVALLFGLVMGAIGNNENEAIGYGKLLSMVVMLAILGATLLPDKWHWVVWWSPLYWIYDILEEVFTESASWGAVWWKSGVTVGISGLYFILLRKKIAKGLS
jgi:ABC-2 type transport system permease protein